LRDKEELKSTVSSKKRKLRNGKSNKSLLDLMLKKIWKFKELREKSVLKSTELSKKESESSVKFKLKLLESKEKNKLKLQLWRSSLELLKLKNRWKSIDSKEKLGLPSIEMSKTESEMKESLPF